MMVSTFTMMVYPLAGGLSFFTIHLSYPGGLVTDSHNISPVGQWALGSELGSCYPGCYPNKTLIEAQSPGDPFKILPRAILLPQLLPQHKNG